MAKQRPMTIDDIVLCLYPGQLTSDITRQVEQRKLATTIYNKFKEELREVVNSSVKENCCSWCKKEFKNVEVKYCDEWSEIYGKFMLILCNSCQAERFSWKQHKTKVINLKKCMLSDFWVIPKKWYDFKSYKSIVKSIQDEINNYIGDNGEEHL